jgi:hypothetical protein
VLVVQQTQAAATAFLVQLHLLVAAERVEQTRLLLAVQVAVLVETMKLVQLVLRTKDSRVVTRLPLALVRVAVAVLVLSVQIVLLEILVVLVVQEFRQT